MIRRRKPEPAWSEWHFCTPGCDSADAAHKRSPYDPIDHEWNRAMGNVKGGLKAQWNPLSRPDAAQALLDDLGARIAAERRRHGIPEPKKVWTGFVTVTISVDASAALAAFKDAEKALTKLGAA